MIKILKTKYSCINCGKEIVLTREIVLDEYTRNIEIFWPRTKCECATGGSSKYKIVDLSIEEVNKSGTK
jgi:hypothetical protein